MRKFYSMIAWAVIIFIGVSCSNTTIIDVSSKNDQLKYMGRIDSAGKDSVVIYWSGTSVEMNFEGDSIDVLISDETGDNYFNVIIDDDSVMLLQPTKEKEYHRLASNLGPGEHTVKLFKRTEYDRGDTYFFGFRIMGNSVLLSKPAVSDKKIEFYGNSITAGYAVEDYSGKDSPEGTNTNNYLSYSALTARHFNAEYTCICKSGIGITVSWFPQIMPEIYNRLDPNDAQSTWDFSNYTPDVVVVNLMQNDSWIVELPDYPEFKSRFGNTKPDAKYIVTAYKTFIENLRTHYPDAHIICALGSMDATQENSVWPGYVNTAVEELQDEKIYTHFFPFKETPGHPNIEEQQVMANSLIQFISSTIGW